MKLKIRIVISLVAIIFNLKVLSQSNTQLPLATFESNRFLLNDYKGSIVVLSFFDSGFPENAKSLDNWAEKYKNDNVVFIAITDDQMKEGEENRMNQELLHFKYISKEENNRIFNKYQTGMFKTFPIQIIIDKNGKEKYKKKGKTNRIAEKLTKRIDALLKMKQYEFKDSELQYTIN